MDIQFDIPSEAVPYILLQRTETQKWLKPLRYYLPQGRKLYNAVYNNFLYQVEAHFREKDIIEQYLNQMNREFEQLKPYLPETTRSILDIGCGIGGINLFLSRYYEDDQPIFYLHDKTEVSDSVYYQFKSDAAFYNSLDVASDFLLKNGVNEKNLYTLDADKFDVSALVEVDLCISLLSWAFHYPLDSYIDEVIECLAEDGSLILDFRRGTGEFGEAIDRFEEHEIIDQTEKYRRTILRSPLKSRLEEVTADQQPVTVP